MHRTGCRFAITTIRVPTSYATTTTIAFEFLSCQSSCTCFVREMCRAHAAYSSTIPYNYVHAISCFTNRGVEKTNHQQFSSGIIIESIHIASSTSDVGDDKSENFYIARTTQTEHLIYLFYFLFLKNWSIFIDSREFRKSSIFDAIDAFEKVRRKWHKKILMLKNQ